VQAVVSQLKRKCGRWYERIEVRMDKGGDVVKE
jgi:hypothetical protein